MSIEVVLAKIQNIFIKNSSWTLFCSLHWFICKCKKKWIDETFQHNDVKIYKYEYWEWNSKWISHFVRSMELILVGNVVFFFCFIFIEYKICIFIRKWKGKIKMKTEIAHKMQFSWWESTNVYTIICIWFIDDCSCKLSTGCQEIHQLPDSGIRDDILLLWIFRLSKMFNRTRNKKNCVLYIHIFQLIFFCCK